MSENSRKEQLNRDATVEKSIEYSKLSIDNSVSNENEIEGLVDVKSKSIFKRRSSSVNANNSKISYDELKRHVDNIHPTKTIIDENG